MSSPLPRSEGRAARLNLESCSFSPLRHDATPGVCEYFPGTAVTAGRALCLCGDAARASRSLIGHSDLLERSASLPLKPGAVLNGARDRDKLPTQPSSTASGRFPKGLWGLSELLSFKVRWQ